VFERLLFLSIILPPLEKDRFLNPTIFIFFNNVPRKLRFDILKVNYMSTTNLPSGKNI
jgi:hypothetical protein